MKSFTFPYKTGGGETSYVDIFLPDIKKELPALPAIVYFHGGGMTVGNRKSWFPSWMHERAMHAGYIFMSADYHLMPPSTGHDIIDDVQDLFQFISQDLNKSLSDNGISEVQVDESSLIVAGTSAGALCAYMAALYAKPKPKAVLCMYGMGGNLLLPQYLAKKTRPFFLGREILDPAIFGHFLHPLPPNLRPTSDSPLAYHPPDSPTPGYPANLRMQLCRLYLQLGVFLDYWTGEHEPSLSVRLRSALALDDDDQVCVSGDLVRASANIPATHLRVFPQFMIDSSFPPTFLVHGESDSAVKKEESFNMQRVLEALNVNVTLRIVEGQEHSFDYAKGAEDNFGTLFDEIFVFLGAATSVNVD